MNVLIINKKEPIFTKIWLKKYPNIHSVEDHTTNIVKIHIHKEDNILFMVLGINIFQKVNSEFILNANIPAMRVRKVETKPAPTISIRIPNPIKMKLPYFLWINRIEHIININEKVIANIPVIRKLDTIVIAGKHPCHTSFALQG